MRRMILILLGLAAAAAAHAVDVPEGKAAVAEAVMGKVLLNAASGSGALAVGQVLEFGDQVVTGANGRVFLRLPSQAVTRLAANTELTLEAAGKRKGTFLTLAKGFMRFLVSHRQPGEAFEVHANNAVAAVKGTDAGVENDGGVVQTTVYDSDHKDAMVVTDTDSGQSHDLDPGQTGILGPNGFDLHDLTDQDRQHGNDVFNGLPHPDLGQGNAPGDGEPGAGSHGNNLGQDAQDALTDLGHDLKVDGNRDSQDRQGDLASGRVVVDRFGVITRIANNVSRPAPDTLVLTTSSQRASGPDTGVTQAQQTTQWNQALPTDWISVVSGANSWMGGSTAPTYWRLNETTVLSNAVQDELRITTHWSSPYELSNLTFTQAFSQDLWAFSQSTPAGVELFYYLYSSASSNGSQAADDTLLASQLASDPSYPSYSSTYSLGSNSTPIGQGAATTYTFGVNGGPTLVQTFNILDSNGVQQPMSAFDQSLVMGNNNGPVIPSDFLGLDRNLNLELGYNVPGIFTQPIDLMVMPQMFDLMEGLQPINQPFNGCRGAC